MHTTTNRGSYRSVTQSADEDEKHELQILGNDILRAKVLKSSRRPMKVCIVLIIILVSVALAVIIGIVAHSKEKDKDIASESSCSPPVTRGSLLAPTPPMGWNSWNKFDCDGLNEMVVRQTALALITSGLADAGYKYVNLDDCWQLKRNISGYIQPDPARFPKGEQSMIELGDFLHKKCLKFGIYTDRGTLTCQRRPGSYGHEEMDAQSYASWGVDFLKNDDCFIYPRADSTNGAGAQKDYSKMHKALNETGRNIIHSIKATMPIDKAHLVSEMRRTGNDVWMSWGSMLSLIDATVKEHLNHYSGPGFWNDLDMLEVGNPGMSQDEQVAHFSLWCAFKAPLILGNDITSMDNFTLTLLKHPGLIAINQDLLGEPVRKVNSQRAYGSAETLIVTDPCNKSDSNQIWYLATHPDQKDTKQQHIQLSTEHLVLIAKPDDFSSNNSYISVAPYNETDKSQWWFLDTPDRSTGQRSPGRLLSLRKTEGNIPSNEHAECLTIGKYDDSYARLRACDALSRIYDNMWVPWETDLIFDFLAKEGHFLIQNSRNKCLAMAALPELDIYAGRLSESRIVVVLLNRDFQQQEMILKWEDLDELQIDKDGSYNVFDVFTGEALGPFAKSMNVIVRPHYTVTLILSPAGL